MNTWLQKIEFCAHTCPPDLSDPERSTLAEIGKRLGRKALAQVASVAEPDPILAWYRKLAMVDCHQRVIQNNSGGSPQVVSSEHCRAGQALGSLAAAQLNQFEL